MPARIEVPVGTRYGNLTTLSSAVSRRSGNGRRARYYTCQCACGNLTEVRSEHLRTGHTKSCGCASKTHGFTGTATHNRWCGMNARCSPTAPCARHYFERGITVCERWQSFQAFLADMGDCPDGYTLERVDNDKGYSRENCCWALPATQTRNTRRNVWLTHDGQTLCLEDWATTLNISPMTLKYRLKHWPPERAFSPRRHPAPPPKPESATL